MLDIFPYLPAMVVEQARLSRRLLEVHLALLNFSQIDGAEDAAAASRLLSNNKYSLIFVNLELSEVSGQEFIGYLARSRPCRSSLLIAMGEDRIERRTAAVRAGADAFLGRPTSPDVLHDLLVELLTSRTAWRAKIVALPTRSSSAESRRQLWTKEPRRDL